MIPNLPPLLRPRYRSRRRCPLPFRRQNLRPPWRNRSPALSLAHLQLVTNAGYRPGKVFSLSGYGFVGAPISLQRLSGAGIWTTVQTSAVLKQDSASLTYKFTAEGTAKIRAVLNKAGKRLSTSAQQTVAYARQETYVQAELAWPTSFNADGRLGRQYPTTISLQRPQRRRGSLRSTVTASGGRAGCHASESPGRKATIKSPLVNATTSKRYRFTIAPTVQEKAWTSGSTGSAP